MTRTTRVGLAAALVVAMLGLLIGGSASCSAGIGNPNPPEASPGDAAPEAAAVKDAAKDTRAADADGSGVDAALGEIPVPGEWLPIVGFPASCAARVAKDPLVSVSRLPWRACASGRVGCESFLADWGVPNQRSFRPVRLEPVFEDAKGIHVSYARNFGRPIGESQGWQSVVQLLHGDGEATWYSSDYCSLLVHGSRHGIAVSTLSIERPGTPEKTYHQLLGWSSWAKPTELEVAEAVLTPKLNISQGVARGADFLTLESTNFGGPIVGTAFRFAQRDFGRATVTNDLLSELPLPVPGGYVSLVATDPPTISFMPVEGGHRTIARPSPRYGMSYIALDRANANALVWSEHDGSDIQTLWTSPFSDTEAGLAKRLVAKLSYDYTFVANAGVVAAVVSPTMARIIRLSDGMGWDIPTEPGLELLTPLWVNDDSAWFILSKPDPIAVTVRSNSGAVRIKRSSLGPPTVPNGL